MLWGRSTFASTPLGRVAYFDASELPPFDSLLTNPDAPRLLLVDARPWSVTAGAEIEVGFGRGGRLLGGRAAFIWTSTAYIRYLEDNAKFPVVAAQLPRDVRASVPTGGLARQSRTRERSVSCFARLFCSAA